MLLVRGTRGVPLFLFHKFDSSKLKTKTMIDLKLLKENPELAKSLKFEMSGADMIGLAEMCINRGRQEKQELIKQEEYLTPQQLADILHVSLVTLWSWDKKGITRPLRIGNAKRYRRSDLEKILSNAPIG